LAGFKATRIRIEGVTFDLDKPICNPVEYQTTRRLPKDKAVEKLVRGGYLKLEGEMKRQKLKEDALIRALKKLGETFGPFP